MKDKKKQIIITLVAIISLIVITVGVTYAFFNYAKEGTTDNTIKTGSITFLYTEVSGVGKGISLTEAYPVADSIGKAQVGEGKVFDFKVTSTISMNSSIDYQVTARKKIDSTLDDSAVKVYLTEVNGTEQELLLSKYSELNQTDRVDSSKYTEKVLYEDTVPANTKNYEKNFRLRMWISDDTDFSGGSMNDKTFTLTVNVYADGKVVTLPANTVYTFDYTGDEQTFTVPATGLYKLETWGAEGGTYTSSYHGGYGGYSSGIINLKYGENISVVVGGAGKSGSATVSTNYGDGGYNGGGGRSGYSCSGCSYGSSGGGGASHIALKSGVLSLLEQEVDSILIVSGGGGGVGYTNAGWNFNATQVPSGGGYKGNVGQNNSGRGGGSGTQNSGYAFGKGQNCGNNAVCDGGGGGYYGGGLGFNGGGGGSGYIGNSLLTDKVMYCYNCEESTEKSTKTISTTCTSETPTENCSKQGNGYARITYLGN